MFHAQLDRLRQHWQQPELVTTLARGAGTALVAQTIGAISLYAAQVLLAQWMGVEQYGIYDYAMTISLTLSFVAGLGVSNAVLRFIPTYAVNQDWSHLRGIVWSSWWQVIATSGLVSLVGIGVILQLVAIGRIPTALQWPLLLGMGLVPLQTLLKLLLEMSRGMKRIALAHLPSYVLVPLLLIGAGSVWIRINGQITSVSALLLSIWVLLGLVVGQFTWFYQQLPAAVHQTRSGFAWRQWFAVSLPLLLIDGSYLVLNQTDKLMLAAFCGTDAVGIYGAAVKTAGWVSFILVAVNAIAAPMFAALYAQNDRAALQQVVTLIARWMFYPALVVALGLGLLAVPVLHLFGAEFVAARWALIALMLGQLVNVGAGSVGYLLTMTGHQNQCALVVGISALVNLGLNLITIPAWGIFGAAFSTALSMALWNLWLNTLVVRHLGVNPSIVAAWQRSRRAS